MSPRGTAKKADTAEAAPALETIETYTIKTIPRAALKNAPYNPRILGDAARQKLKAGITKHGLVQPYVWNERSGHIVAGHQRIALQDSLMGRQDYDVTVAAIDVDEIREKELNILLNNPEAQGEWDLEKLEQMMHTDGIAIEATGFDVADVYRLFGDAPMQERELDELAQRLEVAQKSYADITGNSKKRDSDDFYMVVVFESAEQMGEFLTTYKMPDNRFQDGRYLRRLIEQGLERGDA